MRKRFVLSGRNEYDGSPCHYCFDFDVKFNRHGNIEVIVGSTPSYFVGFFKFGCMRVNFIDTGENVPVTRCHRYVFNQAGVCISHPAANSYRFHKVNAELVESHT